MSSRVLRKLQGDKDLNDEISDNDVDLPVGGGARKKLNINRYDLLNQQSHSESEVKEDDNETEANKSCEGDNNHESVKRKKKKKKKKGKNVNTQRSSEDNAEVDEVEKSVREVNRLLGENFVSKPATSSTKQERLLVKKSILTVQHKHLNPNNELKRIFGSKIIQSEHKRKNRSSGRGHLKMTWLVSGKDTWPQVGKTGLSMVKLDSSPEHRSEVHYFAYEHNQSYRTVQNRFLEAVDSLNPDNIVAIINEYPFHVDTLIQLSDLCRIGEDLAMAAEFIERSLYCLECAFHPLFNISQGNCRLDYRRQVNRALFITLFKHLLFVGGRACYRTALEFCKLLLSLDPEGDPLAIKLAVDFYALRSRQYVWLIDFYEELEVSKNLSQLPNFAFSIPVAYFYMSNGDTSKADSLLQHAILMFPGVLKPLLEKCSVQPDSRVSKHAFFDSHQNSVLEQLELLYVYRTYHVWKENDLLPWLEKNVHIALDKVDKGDLIIKDYELKRSKRYVGSMPRSICRHIILSDIKGVSPLPKDFTGGILSFDPLPPEDSINTYTKLEGLKTRTSSNSTTVGIFFRSLLPTFNPAPADNLQVEDGARALPEGENNDNLRTSVASLVVAMRDLLSHIGTPDVPNEADVDENDESDDDDDDHNNYLT